MAETPSPISRLRLSLKSDTSPPLMAATRPAKSSNDRLGARRAAASPFSESHVWAELDGGWQHLHGSFAEQGYSLEWHDFAPDAELEWSSSFHPDGVEICLNLSGLGSVSDGG